MTHVSEMSDLQCLTLNWRTRVSPGSRDTETWGNCHCSVPVTSRDYNSRTVRLPQCARSTRFAFPQIARPSRAIHAESFNGSRETSIAVHLSSAEPSSSFLRKCPAFIERQRCAGLVRLQGSNEPALLPRSGTFRNAVWVGPSLGEWGSVAQGNLAPKPLLLCPRRMVRHSPGRARRRRFPNYKNKVI